MRKIIIGLFLSLLSVSATFAQMQPGGQISTTVNTGGGHPPYWLPGSAASPYGGGNGGNGGSVGNGGPTRSDANASSAAGISSALNQRRAELQQAQTQMENLRKAIIENPSLSISGPIASTLQNPEAYAKLMSDITAAQTALDRIATQIGQPSPIDLGPTIATDSYLGAGLYGKGANYLITLDQKENRSQEENKIVSQYFDDQGLLKLPESVPGIGDYKIKSAADSELGHIVRRGINSAYAAKLSVALNGNEANPIRQFADQAIFSSMVLDQLGSVATGLQVAVEHSAAFLIGVADGAVSFIEGTVDLADALLFHRAELFSALGNAIRNYDKTYDAIKGFAADKWNEFVAADSLKKSEMLGNLTFQVGSLLVPGAGEAKLGLEAATAGTKAALLVEKIGVGVTENLSKNLVRGLVRLEEASPALAEKIATLEISSAQKAVAVVGNMGTKELAGLNAIEKNAAGWIGKEIAQNPENALRLTRLAQEGEIPILAKYSESTELIAQNFSKEALEAREVVSKGQRVYKMGYMADAAEIRNGTIPSNVLESQFYAFENPAIDPIGFQARHGVAVKDYNFVISGTVKEGEHFVTRPAAASLDGLRPGGAMEVITNPNALGDLRFSMPFEKP